MTNCSCRFSCTSVGVILSVIVGVVTALLTVTGTVTIAPVFFTVAAATAAGALIILFLAAVFGRFGCSCCVQNSIAAVLIGVLGVLATAAILTSVVFAATSILGAVVTGLLLAFLSLIFVSYACLIRCLTDCDN